MKRARVGKTKTTKRMRMARSRRSKAVRVASRPSAVEREAMRIPFIRTLSQQDPELGRILRQSYILGTRTSE